MEVLDLLPNDCMQNNLSTVSSRFEPTVYKPPTTEQSSNSDHSATSHYVKFAVKWMSILFDTSVTVNYTSTTKTILDERVIFFLYKYHMSKVLYLERI